MRRVSVVGALALAALGLAALPPAARAQGAADRCASERLLVQLAPRHVGDPVCTRGLPMPARAAAAPAAPAAQAAAVDERPSVDLSLQFASGSSELDDAARRQLDILAVAMRNPDLAGARFLIEGHTDTVGDRSRNQMLSEQRAVSVVRYLTGEGIDSARLQSKGVGEDALLVPTPDQTPEPRNRRVHVVNLGG
jgi:outer membrane protein OmpA-like peptidoglycan-associated protein